jgi:Ser/Thr protein kinase RdoA (MazF antagonist)
VRQAHEDDSLAAPFVPLTPADGARLAEQRWGVRVTGAERLETERDDTFRLETDVGTVVLKVANPADPAEVVGLQCSALQHIARVDPELLVPRVLPAVDGTVVVETEGASGERRLARLLGWLPGRTVDYARMDAEGRRSVGAVLARLSLALQGFEHPGADRVLAWDLQRLGGLRSRLHHVSDDDARVAIEAELDLFDTEVGPALAEVRHQVVHNDANPDNVLVGDEGRATGVLDFGDMVRTAVVADLAVAMAYATPPWSVLSESATDPWADPYDIARGYVSVRPLDDRELGLLPHLVRGRRVQSAVVNAWLADTNPDNPRHERRPTSTVAPMLRLLAESPVPEDL